MSFLSTPPKKECYPSEKCSIGEPRQDLGSVCQMRLPATPHFSCPKETHSQDMSRGRSHSRCGRRSWPRSRSTNQACPLELLGKLCKLLGVIACPAGIQYKRGSLAVGLIHQEKLSEMSHASKTKSPGSEGWRRQLLCTMIFKRPVNTWIEAPRFCSRSHIRWAALEFPALAHTLIVASCKSLSGPTPASASASSNCTSQARSFRVHIMTRHCRLNSRATGRLQLLLSRVTSFFCHLKKPYLQCWPGLAGGLQRRQQR